MKKKKQLFFDRRLKDLFSEIVELIVQQNVLSQPTRVLNHERAVLTSWVHFGKRMVMFY